MYRAKQRGGGQFHVFNDALRNRAIRQLSTEIELRHAVDHDEPGQGYHLGRPQPAAHIQRLLNQTNDWHPAGI